jgi:flavin-dependent dehydrogenase
MDNIYDLIVIGTGPCGLALAQSCCKLNLKILVIDQEASIGGCHRCRRVYVPEVNEYLFTEHGPRI